MTSLNPILGLVFIVYSSQFPTELTGVPDDFGFNDFIEKQVTENSETNLQDQASPQVISHPICCCYFRAPKRSYHYDWQPSFDRGHCGSNQQIDGVCVLYDFCTGLDD